MMSSSMKSVLIKCTRVWALVHLKEDVLEYEKCTRKMYSSMSISTSKRWCTWVWKVYS